jgi:hypothetical protein
MQGKMKIGRPGEERIPEVEGRARRGLYVGSISYKTGNKTQNKC